MARLFLVAAVFGGVVAFSILAFGRISGSQINPAVTFAQTVRDRQGHGDSGLFIVTQLVAALTAGVLLSFIFSSDESSAQLGSTSLAGGVPPALGLAMEFAGTFVLAFVVLSAPRMFPSIPGQAAAVGLTLFVLIVLIGPFTGASFNPARSLGPAVAAGYFENLWLFVVGPLAGGGLAGLVARARQAS